MPRVIVFDFFGVICSEVAPFWLEEHVGQAAGKELKRNLIHAADRGVISQAEMFADLGARSGQSASQVLAAWNSLVHVDPAMVELVDHVRTLARVSLLSNCPAPFVRDILRRHDLERRFESIVVSAEEGMAKPEPAIFHLALSRLGVAPADAVMVDDNPTNVQAARTVGMRAIQFESAAQCRERLDRELA